MATITPARNSGEIPLRDRLYMDPVEKYQVYDIFPWVLVLHILLVFLTSTQVGMVVNSSSQYSYSQLTLWNEIFLNRDVQGSDNSLTMTYHVFNIGDLLTYVQKTVDRYFDINSHTVDNYSHDHSNGKIKPIHMYVEYGDRSEANDKGYRQLYHLTPDDLGPFQHYNLKEFLDVVSRFEFVFTLKHYLHADVPVPATCYSWTLHQRFDYALHGPITVTLDVDRGICSNGTYNIFKKFMWINLAVFICGFLSFSLTARHLYSRALLMSTFKKNQRGSIADAWENLTLKEKFRFIDMWIILNTIGNLCQIFGSLGGLLESYNSMTVLEIVCGIGCFCSWVGVLRFLKPAPTSYTVVNTIKRSYSRLLPYIIGILPVFMAFAFLSMCLFWKTGNYTSPQGSMLVNFAMLNGDSLYPFFSEAVDANFVFGQIFMYAYLVFFITCVQNIFVAIFQEGYNSLQVNPVKRGDESDEDDDFSDPFTLAGSPMLAAPSSPKLTKKQTELFIEKEENKRKSQKALKKILAGKLVLPLLNDMTQVYMERLEKALEDIKTQILTLVESAEPLPGEIVDQEKLKDRLNDMLSIELQDHVDKTIIP